MKFFYTIVLSFFLLLNTVSAIAQNNFWNKVPESALAGNTEKRFIIPTKYATYTLDITGLKAFLSTVPLEFTEAAKNNPVILQLPMPNGSIQKFIIVESPIMEPELAAKFPDIKTYSGQGVDDKYATLKMDWTEFGFHAQIRSVISGSSYIDPYASGNQKNYIVYSKENLVPKTFKEIGVIDNGTPPVVGKFPGLCFGTQLRKYRLAVACTHQYAAFFGGTASAVHSAIVTTVNRVDGVYETEFAVRLVLIANNNLIEFINAATDPFTGNDDANTLITESQTQINSKIGSANYDVGHTFSTGAGGLSNLGAVCQSSQKAGSITGGSSPVGDAYDIDYVAHEMGHCFGGNHTFNATTGSCGGGNRNGSTAVEPGSGITIMAYAGICNAANDLDPHSIAYFHTTSIYEIGTYTTTGAGNNCPVKTATGNNPPVVNAGADYTIPPLTPFTLTGSATDPDGDALTYSWEENDIATSAGNWNSGNAPFFRSFDPTVSPSRTFPKLSDILTATTTIGEFLPKTAKTLNFRLTVRDNKMGGGGLCNDDMILKTTGTAAFTVTSQAIATAWVANGTNTATITWNVVNTAIAPISCANVTILFSADGGLTFPYTLAASTPNNGTATVIIPSVNTTTGRVKVASIGNVFFNINKGIIAVTIITPVKFTELKAQKSVDKVLLSWGTLTEENSTYFEAERSANGKDFITIVGTTKAAGNSNSARNYTITDTKPLTALNYYRIKQFDADGKFAFSNIATINFDKNPAPIALYPNPAKSVLNIEYTASKTAKVQARIMDSKGSVLINTNFNTISGINTYHLNIENLTKGAYIIEWIEADAKHSFMKFIKQ